MPLNWPCYRGMAFSPIFLILPYLSDVNTKYWTHVLPSLESLFLRQLPNNESKRAKTWALSLCVSVWQLSEFLTCFLTEEMETLQDILYHWEGNYLRSSSMNLEKNLLKKIKARWLQLSIFWVIVQGSPIQEGDTEIISSKILWSSRPFTLWLYSKIYKQQHYKEIWS